MIWKKIVNRCDESMDGMGRWDLIGSEELKKWKSEEVEKIVKKWRGWNDSEKEKRLKTSEKVKRSESKWKSEEVEKIVKKWRGQKVSEKVKRLKG
jgi:hypothetical protein